MPDEIANAPELLDGSEFYLKAFEDLSTERNHSMGVMRIPWSKIQHYGELKGLHGAHIEDFHFIIRSVDNVYCEWLDKQNEQRPTVPSEPSNKNQE